jgi:hypothetical protein
MGVQIQGDTGNVIATKGTYSGNVTIGGTLTYEDVTNIDSVGLITAREGIEIGARPGVAASISVDGNMIVSGISTFGGAASFGGNVSIGDNDELRIGDGSDLKLKHDTNNSIVTNATGELLIDSSIINLRDTSNNSRLRVEPAGNVNVASNLKVAGVCTATSFSGSGANLTGIVAIPSGAIILWSGAANAIPSGFVLCDGNNSTPNLSGKFVVGYDASNGDYDVGDTGGSESVTLTVDQIPAHTHPRNYSSHQPSSGTNGFRAANNSLGNIDTGSTGGGQSHENRPPFYALCYIMKT